MVAKEVNNLGGQFINIDASLMGPEDMGLPTSGGVVAPYFLPQDNGYKGNGGVIIFSDVNRANIQVLSSIMKLATSRKIGNYVLPDKWVVVATSGETGFNHSFEDRFEIVQM